MCMLSYYPAGVMPRADRLDNGAEANPDGHGFAIVTERRQLIIHRDMNAERMIDQFLDLRSKHLNGPALFHSRIATSGIIAITGCHPFRVGRDNRTVVAHNGVLFSTPQGSLQSYTAIFAKKMLPRFGSLDSPSKFAKLERFTRGNKLVILTVNPQRRKTSYIVNEDAGIWTHDGEWHSNDDYTGWKSWKSRKDYDPKPKTDDARDTEPWPCDVCHSWNSVSTLTLTCAICQSCNDCLMSVDDCLCSYAAQAYGKKRYPGRPAVLALPAGNPVNLTSKAN